MRPEISTLLSSNQATFKTKLHSETPKTKTNITSSSSIVSVQKHLILSKRTFKAKLHLPKSSETFEMVQQQSEIEHLTPIPKVEPLHSEQKLPKNLIPLTWFPIKCISLYRLRFASSIFLQSRSEEIKLSFLRNALVILIVSNEAIQPQIKKPLLHSSIPSLPSLAPDQGTISHSKPTKMVNSRPLLPQISNEATTNESTHISNYRFKTSLLIKKSQLH